MVPLTGDALLGLAIYSQYGSFATKSLIPLFRPVWCNTYSQSTLAQTQALLTGNKQDAESYLFMGVVVCGSGSEVVLENPFLYHEWPVWA